MMFIFADTLPWGDDGGYVVAAYIVFIGLLVVYISIMASKLTRMQRDLRELSDGAPEPESHDERVEA